MLGELVLLIPLSLSLSRRLATSLLVVIVFTLTGGAVYLLASQQTVQAAIGDSTITPNYGPKAGGNVVTISVENATPFTTIADYGATGVIMQATQGSSSSYVSGGGFDGSDVIALRGRNNYSVAENASYCGGSGRATMNNTARYAFTADFTNYNTLEYYTRKGADHGGSVLSIDDPNACSPNWLNSIHYNTFPTTWTAKSLDVSNLTGTHTIYFSGGYNDNTGNLTSETQYSAIRLADYPTAVTIGGKACDTLTLQRQDTANTSTVTCIVPSSGVPGLVDVVIESSETTTLQDGYSYNGAAYILNSGSRIVGIVGNYNFASLLPSDINLIIDGQACTNVVIISDSYATCQAPAHSDGKVSATLEISGTEVAAFPVWYYSFSPNSGSVNGDTELNISGLTDDGIVATPLSLTDGTLYQAGSYSAASSILPSGGYSGGPILNLIGRSAANSWNGAPHYTISLDLTDIYSLSFYARKINNHGSALISVDGVGIYSVHYNTLPSSWTNYQLDLSSYSGVHTLTLTGGYGDTSGNTSSQTQYSDIYLDGAGTVSALSSVTLDGQACTGLTFDAVSGVATCDTPAHAAGLADVGFNFTDGDTEIVEDGFEYVGLLSLTVDKSGLNMSGLPNALIADYLTANVITNNPTGYHLDIESAEPRLTCSSYDTDYYIEPLGSGETGAMLDNKWGYAVGAVGVETPPSVWTGVSGSPAVFDNYTTATDPALGQDTRLWFGTKVNMSLPACSYGGSVTITAIANGS
jgi:hypothetical protein